MSLPAGPNGATLRYLHFSKWLREAGFSIHFAVGDSTFDQDQLDGFVKDGWIDGFSKLNDYRAAGRRHAFSKLLVLPGLRNRIMAREKAPAKEELIAQIRRLNADICMISDRGYLYCVTPLAQISRVVIDWMDSYSLFYWRALLESIRSNAWRQIPNLLRQGLICFLDERYYARFSHANLVVSPVDRDVIRRICPSASDLRIIPNGVEFPDRNEHRPKVKDRLVFSGRMDFLPNYQSALWFIDRVLPSIRKRHPAAHLVIAGANPVPELKARESEFVRVTGHVPDMSKELAQASLYVAPLVSGSGFKNKVLESIAAGTAIVGTPLAAEFLPPELNEVVLVANDPATFADTVVRCLEKPEVLTAGIERAQQFLRVHFSWKARTVDLISVLDPTH